MATATATATVTATAPESLFRARVALSGIVLVSVLVEKDAFGVARGSGVVGVRGGP